VSNTACKSSVNQRMQQGQRLMSHLSKGAELAAAAGVKLCLLRCKSVYTLRKSCKPAKHEIRSEAYTSKRAGLAGGGGVVQSLAGQSEGLHSRVSPAPGTVDACRANPLEGPLCQGVAALRRPCKGA